MRRTPILPALGALLALPAMAAPLTAPEAPDYRDDRSTPAALIESLYNAVSRHEYSRAWSYYAEDARPAADYAAYVRGYEQTVAVEVAVGEVREEAGMSQVHATVPVAIAALGTDRSVTVFAGCYVTHFTQPAVQDPPFLGIRIVAGKLVKRPGARADRLPAALPSACAEDGTPAF